MRVIEVETKDHLISAFKQAENKYLYNQHPTEIRIKRKSGSITSYVVGDTNRLYKGEMKLRQRGRGMIMTDRVEEFKHNNEIVFSKGIKKTLAIIRKSKKEDLFS